jgi:hypothetical protein
MAASLQSRVQLTVSRVDWNAMNRIQSVERCNGRLARLYGISILKVACYYIHRLTGKEPDHQQQVLHSVTRAFKR